MSLARQLCVSVLVMFALVAVGCAEDGGLATEDALSADRYEAEVLPEVVDAFERKDLEAAYALALPFAEAGVARAQFDVALFLIWEDGQVGGLRDREEAERASADWLRRSAAGGYDEAVGYLADSYRNGWRGFPRSDALYYCWTNALSDKTRISGCVELENDLIKSW